MKRFCVSVMIVKANKITVDTEFIDSQSQFDKLTETEVKELLTSTEQAYNLNAEEGDSAAIISAFEVFAC